MRQVSDNMIQYNTYSSNLRKQKSCYLTSGAQDLKKTSIIGNKHLTYFTYIMLTKYCPFVIAQRPLLGFYISHWRNHYYANDFVYAILCKGVKLTFEKRLTWLTCTMNSISSVSWFARTIMAALGASADSLSAAAFVVYCTLVNSCVNMVSQKNFSK